MSCQDTDNETNSGDVLRRETRVDTGREASEKQKLSWASDVKGSPVGQCERKRVLQSKLGHTAHLKDSLIRNWAEIAFSHLIGKNQCLRWWARYLANRGFSQFLHFLTRSWTRRSDHVNTWHATANTWLIPTHSNTIRFFPNEILIKRSIVRFNRAGLPSRCLITAKTRDRKALVNFIQ